MEKGWESTRMEKGWESNGMEMGWEITGMEKVYRRVPGGRMEQVVRD